MSTRRAAAIGALLFGLAGLALAAVIAVQEFPRGLIALACVTIAAAAAWFGIVRRGAARVAGLAIGAAGLAVAIGLLVGERLLEELLVVAALVLGCVLGRAAFAIRARLPRAPAPLQPVLFFNPKSGGGKAEKFALASEARSRGIEPIELGPAVGPGAARPRRGRRRRRRAGDGRRRRLAGRSSPRSPRSSRCRTRASPRAPATTSRSTSASTATTSSARSTRSSTAASGASTSPRSTAACSSTTSRSASTPTPSSARATAMPSCGPSSTPCPTCSGQTRPGSTCAGPDPAGTSTTPAPRSSSPTTATASDARSARAPARGSTTGCSASPSRGHPRAAASSGRRPQRPWREWTAPRFKVDSDHPVPAGIDGEAVKLEPPLRFRIRAGVLRVRIARQHPGASPSASLPEGLGQSARALARIAAGR